MYSTPRWGPLLLVGWFNDPFSHLYIIHSHPYSQGSSSPSSSSFSYAASLLHKRQRHGSFFLFFPHDDATAAEDGIVATFYFCLDSS